eukprot:15730475-Heterocapsa_arctica.AAC.1
MSEFDLSDDALVALGGLGGVSEIEVKSCAADVDDCFYQFTVPEVASWFGVRQRVDANAWGARRIYDDATKGYRSVSPGELLYP